MRTSNRFSVLAAIILCVFLRSLLLQSQGRAEERSFCAGAAAVDVTPQSFPVHVSGGFLPHRAHGATSQLFAKALVLDDGLTELAIVVVDTLMAPRNMIDRAKELACEATGIPVDRMLISATHTHSAPALGGVLGTDADTTYAEHWPEWIAQAVRQAHEKLEPAEAGWAVVRDAEHTHCRRWILRPDRLRYDPFGFLTVRAQMHPGYQNPDFLGPSGPVDPDITILSLRSRAGRPLALLANYSMHYFGAMPVSADYFGAFSARMAELVAAADCAHQPVVAMSQGTSGDQHWMDYSQPRKEIDLKTYAGQIAQTVFAEYQTIAYRSDITLAMSQRLLRLERRVPDPQRLSWARRMLAAMGDRPAQSQPEVYSREQVILHEEPNCEIVLQAIRIGDLGITAIPNEVYAITGLKLKGQSPLAMTMNIELANGCEGYLPPPEQHAFGGYTTWPARTSALETQAEPKIVDAVLGLLEDVAGKPRRKPADMHGAYAKRVLAAKPMLYWRLSEFEGAEVHDATGRGHGGTFEGLMAYYLEGPASSTFSGEQPNRAVQLAGGRIRAALGRLGDTYTVELWIHNQLPNDARPMTGCIFSRGTDAVLGPTPGDHLVIGGDGNHSGRLVFFSGLAGRPAARLAGNTDLPPGQWHHVVLVRDGRDIAVYLNGNREPELAGQLPVDAAAAKGSLFVGGRSDNVAGFEGRIDEVAIYERPLTANEVADHFGAARYQHL